MEKQKDEAIIAVGVYSVTPENKFCFKCKKENCKGVCKEYREHIKAERQAKKEKLHKKQQF